MEVLPTGHFTYTSRYFDLQTCDVLTREVWIRCLSHRFGRNDANFSLVKG